MNAPLTKPSAGGGSAVAAAVAFAATLPALGLPLMSDDWSLLYAVEDGVPLVHPFGYVRPVTLAAYWLGSSLAGVSAWPYRVAALVLIPACAAMVVALFDRWSGRRGVATAAGVLFALHPLHVGVAAWAAALGDVLACSLVLASGLWFERWHRSGRAGSLAWAIGSYTLALLSKEVAVCAPGLFLLGPYLDRSRPVRLPRLLAGLAPMASIGALHLLVLRPWLLATDGTGLPWPGAARAAIRAAYYAAATVFPMPGSLEAAPFLFGGVVLAAGLVWTAAAARRDPETLRLAAIGAAAAAVLAAPAVIAFQGRHVFLASTAASFALAAVVAAGGARVVRVSVALGVLVWGAAIARHWDAWYAAAAVSRPLVQGIVERARDVGLDEIVVANVPHRVRGAPVFGSFSSAVDLHTGRSMPVRSASRIDLLSPGDDALDGPFDAAVTAGPSAVVVRLRPGSGRGQGLVLPRLSEAGVAQDPETGRVELTPDGGLRLMIPWMRDRRRAVLVWHAGRLVAVTPPVRGFRPQATGHRWGIRGARICKRRCPGCIPRHRCGPVTASRRGWRAAARNGTGVKRAYARGWRRRLFRGREDH